MQFFIRSTVWLHRANANNPLHKKWISNELWKQAHSNPLSLKMQLLYDNGHNVSLWFKCKREEKYNRCNWNVVYVLLRQFKSHFSTKFTRQKERLENEVSSVFLCAAVNTRLFTICVERNKKFYKFLAVCGSFFPLSNGSHWLARYFTMPKP